MKFVNLGEFDFSGHALHEKVLQRQIGGGAMFYSQQQRALVDKPQINS